MTNIPKISLEDSLYVIQLARETALAQNRQTQANRMAPLVDEMRTLISAPTQAAGAPAAAGVMGQADFKTLLSVTQTRATQSSAASVMDRNRLIGAMSQANMSDVDIARQFSITREEVQLVLNVQQKNKSYAGELK